MADVVLGLDETAALVHASAGATFDEIEAAVELRGLTLGPLPVASRGRTLEALLAAPRPSEATPRGRFLDRCIAIDAVLADGTEINTRLAPRKATGPNLMFAIVGANGTTGIIHAAWLRLSRRPARELMVGYAFTDGAAALGVARALLDAGARPADMVIADGRLLPAGLAAPVGDGGTLVGLRLDGVAEVVAAEEALAAELAVAAGGAPLTALALDGWVRGPTWPAAAPWAERFIGAVDLEARWARRERPSLLAALRPAGAALVSTRLPAARAPSRPAEALRLALRRRLDPHQRLRHLLPSE